VKNIVSKTAWPARLLPALPFVIASLFICAALAGWLCSAGCAHTPAGLQRETQLYLVSSNAVDGLKTITPYVPAPINSVLEGVLACGGALLALWATHLHRSLNEVRNGKLAGTSTPSAPPPPAPAT